ncbi:MAG: hypothetical protein ACFE9L_09060 [Candidatus Hodarchaeota archaeon]
MTVEEEKAFKRFNTSEVDSRWGRMKWVKDLERKYGLEEIRSVPIHSMRLYWDSTISYVYKTFFCFNYISLFSYRGFFKL